VSPGQALPLLVALLVAGLIGGRSLRALSDAGLERDNYRGARVPLPAGAVIVAAAALALVPLAALDDVAGLEVFRPELVRASLYVLGVAFLGMLDDLLAAEPRGWRGHGAAVLSGGLSSGALKAGGSLGLAMLALSDQDLDIGAYLTGVAVLVLATNLFNLLDLRPGRSFKVFVVLAAALTLGAWDVGPLAGLGLFVGPVLVVGAYDLRERAMLGDTGSNLIGALAGLWMLLTLPLIGQAIALAVMAAITAYGEFRSISELVERRPLLRRLDSMGRPRCPTPGRRPDSSSSPGASSPRWGRESPPPR
jgi:UDP-N-acetylmuramyl pentapeptide phosphotransferase/UDP-N-acetylglucosamine-1-phosphate transferase